MRSIRHFLIATTVLLSVAAHLSLAAAGDPFFDRASAAIEQILSEPMERRYPDHLDLALTLVRLRGSAVDKDLLRRAAAKPLAPPTVEIEGLSPKLEADYYEERVQRALGNAAAADAALQRAGDEVAATPDDGILKNAMFGAVALAYAKAGDIANALVWATKPTKTGFDDLGLKILARDAYIRGDDRVLTAVLARMKERSGAGPDTLQEIGRLPEAEAAVPSLTTADAREHLWSVLADAYDRRGDAAARHRCLIAERKAVDENSYTSIGPLADLGLEMMGFDEPDLARVALNDAIAKPQPAIFDLQAVAMLAASLHDPRLPSLLKQLDAAWTEQLQSFRDQIEREKTNPTTMPGPNGTVTTINTDIPEEQAEHELNLAAIFAFGGDDTSMWTHLRASVAAKRLAQYDNSEGFSRVCHALSNRGAFDLCRQVLTELCATDADRQDGYMAMARAAIRAGRWDDAWSYVERRAELRHLGLCIRVLDHWVAAGEMNKCLAALDGIKSPSGRAMLALHLGARSKGLPAASVFDLEAGPSSW
jgi:hypothetical protein